MSGQISIRDGDVDTAVIAEFEVSRRDAVRRGLAFGATTLAASSIPILLGTRNAFAATDGDAAIVRAAVGLEQTAVFAYATAIRSKLLDGPTARVARLFHRHEREHADALTKALKGLGGAPPPAPKGVSDVDKVVGGLGDVKTQAQMAMFAIELETAAVAAYYDAHQKLKSSALLQTAAQIMANEGQHLVVLRQVINRNPVPNAFETGKANQ